ncbi:MAG: GtrA family protein, partial [Lentisphaerota bacterium]
RRNGGSLMMNGIVEQFMGHEAGPLVQFIKYAIGGVAATAVDVLCFYTLSWKLLPAMKENDPVARLLKLKIHHIEEDVRSRRFVINTCISFLFSNFTAYVINVFWVFHAGKYAWYVELGLFYAVSGISIAIGTFLGWVLIRAFHLSTTSSYATKGISALMINYVCRKFLIFNG